MKNKFKNLDFGSIDVLSREEQKKVKGGGYPTPWLNIKPHLCLDNSPARDTWKCTQAQCNAVCQIPCEPYNPGPSYDLGRICM
jgi:hypothetical protein